MATTALEKELGKALSASTDKEIEVWGDGSSKREFLYIDDFAEFVVNLSKSNLKFPDFLNIGYIDRLQLASVID